LTVIVDLPTPPFWLNTTVRMEGSGYDGRGSESPSCGDRYAPSIRTTGIVGVFDRGSTGDPVMRRATRHADRPAGGDSPTVGRVRG
jgi:hypothetical protein